MQRFFNDCKTWLLNIIDIRGLLVFDYKCLQCILVVCCDHLVSDAVVIPGVLVKEYESVVEIVNVHWLRWLRDILCLPNYHPTRCDSVGVDLDKAGVDQLKCHISARIHRQLDWAMYVDLDFLVKDCTFIIASHKRVLAICLWIVHGGADIFTLCTPFDPEFLYYLAILYYHSTFSYIYF